MDSNKDYKNEAFFVAVQKNVWIISKMLGNGISLTLQIILFGMQFKLAKSLCTSEKGLWDQNPYLQDLLIRVLFSVFFWEGLINLAIDNSIQYPSNFFKILGH